MIPGSRIIYIYLYNKVKYSLFHSFNKVIVFQKKIKLNLKLEDWIQNQIYFLGFYEDFELKILESYLCLGDTFIDIGANFGLYSLYASKLVGDKGKILAFEPFLENYNACNENIQLNNFKNVSLVKQAIGENRKEVPLFYNYNESNLGMVSIYKNDFTEQEIVICDSLDNYLILNKLDSISFIKIDIEGAEYSALLGMINTLKEYKPIIQLEIDDNILANTPYSRKDIYKFMNDLDYELFIPELLKRVKRNKYSKNQYFRAKE